MALIVKSFNLFLHPYYDKPSIFNTDQGSPVTSEAFTGVLESAGVAIGMNGRGRQPL